MFGEGGDQATQRAASKGKAKQEVSVPCEGSTSRVVLPVGASASGASTSTHVHPEQTCNDVPTNVGDTLVERATGRCASLRWANTFCHGYEL